MTTPRYFPELGGVENHVYQVARRLAGPDVSVTVLTTDVTRTLAPDEESDGIQIRRVPAWPANHDYYFAPRILTEIARGNWDIVHVQSYHTLVAPIAMRAARKAEVPYVVTFHGGGHSSRVRHNLRPLQLLLLRPLLARADRLVALADFEIDHYARHLRIPRRRFVVIPNGSDLPTPPDFQRVSKAALLVSIGRLERYKGHHRVLAALPHVLRRRRDARLWIAGAGPYGAALKQLADALAVSDRVEIRAVPAEQRDRMAQELAGARVAVLLSEFETQPIAALEALALGCRLVVADTPGLRELAEDGLARAVPLDSSPEEIAAALLEELERSDVTSPPDLPTWDGCAAALLKLYHSVLDERRRQRR